MCKMISYTPIYGDYFMLKVSFDQDLSEQPELGDFMHWALFSIAYTLELNGEPQEDIKPESQRIFQKLLSNVVGNTHRMSEMKPEDFEMLYESIINWVANNKDGFVPLDDNISEFY